MNLTRNAQLIGGIGVAGAGAGLGAGLSAVSLDLSDLLLTLGLALAAIGLLLVSVGWFWPRRKTEELAMVAVAMTLVQLNATSEQARKLLLSLRETHLIAPSSSDKLLRIVPMLTEERSPQPISLERAVEILQEAEPMFAEETLREAARLLAETHR